MAIEQLDPTSCKLWQFHQRLEDEVDHASCKELIESMALHGQRYPVLGRLIGRDSGSAVELVYGARRLFAARTLGIKLLVDVRELDDRSAAIEMEIENRERIDISPYARGLSYRRWLSANLFASQAELAKDLCVSEAQVSRLLRYAELPAAVVGAFDSPLAIREEWAVALARACLDPVRRPTILRRAREIANTEPRRAAPVIYHRLISEEGSMIPKNARSLHEVVTNSSGRPIYKIAVRASAVHFIVPRDVLSERLLRELKTKLASALEQQGNEVQRSRPYVRVRKPCTDVGDVTAATPAG